MTPRRLFISFSGGETSGMMTQYLLSTTMLQGLWDEVLVLFSNTGEENEETLEFVHMCDQHFGFNTVWVEAVVHHGERKANTHRIVDFQTASRDGSPYEADIQKYGIPCKAFPHCTRNLKLNPMKSYLRSIGWEPKSYTTAIGIRADEEHRRSKRQQEMQLFYPFLDFLSITKPDVNQFWTTQPFRLNLMGYQGNCKWCWKKSVRKLLTIMDDDPAMFDFPERMEALYNEVGPEFAKEVRPGYCRSFFRENVSTKDLRLMYSQGHSQFDRAGDDSLIMPDGTRIPLDAENDDGSGCSESCEINFDEEDAVE